MRRAALAVSVPIADTVTTSSRFLLTVHLRQAAATIISPRRIAMKNSQRLILSVISASVALMMPPKSAMAAQLCGCKKLSNGRVARIAVGTVSPPCNPASQATICWNDDTPPPPPPDFSAGAHNYDATHVTVPDVSYLWVPFPTKDWDTANILDGTDPTKLVAPIAGRYLVTAAVGFSGNGNGLRELILFVNGVTRPTGFGQQMLPPVVGGEETFLSTSAILDLNTGDYVQVVVAQNSGGPLDLYPSSQVARRAISRNRPASSRDRRLSRA